MSKDKDNEHPAVTRFRQYLRFPSVHPNPDYSGCIKWLKEQAKEIDLEFHKVEFPKPNEFAVWLTWKGTDPSLKTILLNSHLDVVPVERDQWTYEPFGAEKDAEGNIYARGAQDMKCVGSQYLEAIRELKAKGFVPLRTVHVSFVPDEELGGRKGMGYFVKTPDFENLNVGFALDEGLACPDEAFRLYYGQRVGTIVRVIAKGKAGHGSIMHEDTAGEKLLVVMNKLMELRKEQKNEWHSCPHLHAGDITSVNMTMLGGGQQANVVPRELNAVFDIRIRPEWKLEDLSKMLDGFCTESGPGVSYEYISASAPAPHTLLTSDNIWWTTFKDACDTLDIKLKTRIFPGGTDIRFVQQVGIPAFGFSPMNKTTVRLHDHDEYLNENIYLRGIQIYEAILQRIINVPNADTA